uniref:Uncharacterized protein n=1 Tax=Arundo donax TaxID=35708 RepID=A0A0A9AT54_ARUDO
MAASAALSIPPPPGLLRAGRPAPESVRCTPSRPLHRMYR